MCWPLVVCVEAPTGSQRSRSYVPRAAFRVCGRFTEEVSRVQSKFGKLAPRDTALWGRSLQVLNIFLFDLIVGGETLVCFLIWKEGIRDRDFK